MQPGAGRGAGVAARTRTRTSDMCSLRAASMPDARGVISHGSPPFVAYRRGTVRSAVRFGVDGVALEQAMDLRARGSELAGDGGEVAVVLAQRSDEDLALVGLEL